MIKFDFKTTFHPLAEFLLKHDFRRRGRVKRYLRNHDIVKLQVGSGTHILPDWLNTDKSVSGCRAGAVYMDVSKRFLLPDDSVDYVYSEHLFEHLTLSQAKNMLNECYRVMKKDGIIRIATPNLEFLVDLYLHPDKDINKRYIEWAAKEGRIPAEPVYVVNRFHTTWGHQIVYDFNTLAKLMEDFGFKDIRRCEMSKSNHPELCDIEGHFHVMPYDFCCLETMILEAKK